MPSLVRVPWPTQEARKTDRLSRQLAGQKREAGKGNKPVFVKDQLQSQPFVLLSGA